ncbi:phospholipase D-like domain-containing protein [Pseudomonas sp. 8O]|uniref:phospholipase D-like domain-containing protein n=1 Tax=Pseudomonas sp. 8O TaxID=2653165 RepID=UPI0012F2B989|nr:phospholipase D-like domain-containing protein [Pseudomonas sp. 8O]VXB18038.1 conserved hypothetical protein [Pseudomonas sp. 8O]
MYQNNPKIMNSSHFEDIGYHLKNELRKAKSSIKICVAWIRWSDYNPIFNELARKGVRIEVLYNDDHINRRNFVSPDHSVVLYPVRGRFYNSLMHNKFCVVDNRVVITGSFNWSQRAYSHFENIVFIENDFKLVKSFLHEFEDLKNYYDDYNNQSKIACPYEGCRSLSYNLGVLGDESGLYDESLVDIWNVCFKSGHLTFLGEQYENHLHLHLGIKDVPDREDSDGYYGIESMLSELKNERDRVLKLQEYFVNSRKNKIHAVGMVSMINQHEHIEWGEEQEYAVNILWSDMYYRKLIPDVIYDGDCDIDCIVRRHR